MKISKGLLNPNVEIFYVDLDLKDRHFQVLYKFNLPNAKIPPSVTKFLKTLPTIISISKLSLTLIYVQPKPKKPNWTDVDVFCCNNKVDIGRV